MSGEAEANKCLLKPNNIDDGDEANDCGGGGIIGTSSNSILNHLLQLGANEDLAPYTRLALEEENELQTAVINSTSTHVDLLKTVPKIRPPSLSEISFSEGPSKEPEEGL